MEIEVAIPSIANPTYTCYVVITIETKRLVNEIHDHKEELGPATNCSQNFKDQ